MGSIGRPETSVTYYHSTRRKVREERRSLLLYMHVIVDLLTTLSTALYSTYSRCVALHQIQFAHKAMLHDTEITVTVSMGRQPSEHAQVTMSETNIMSRLDLC